jgi:hypothetical protein
VKPSKSEITNSILVNTSHPKSEIRKTQLTGVRNGNLPEKEISGSYNRELVV